MKVRSAREDARLVAKRKMARDNARMRSTLCPASENSAQTIRPGQTRRAGGRVDSRDRKVEDGERTKAGRREPDVVMGFVR